MKKIKKHPTIYPIAKTWSLHRYLQKNYLEIKRQGHSDQDYLNSLVRRQHGIGGSWMGSDNGGSDDCAKERFRRITDALGLKNKTPLRVWLRTGTCLNETNFIFKGKNKNGKHRVEHTNEVAGLYKEWELDKIMSPERFTPNEMGRWVIERQIVVLCEDAEQIRGWKWDSNKPFSKYSTSVYNALDGSDVSNYTLEQIQELNRKVYQRELELIDSYDFTQDIERARKSFDASDHHFLPPIDVMVQRHELTKDNQHWFLENIYKEKLRKLKDLTKTGKNGYDPQLVKEHNDWKSRQPI